MFFLPLYRYPAIIGVKCLSILDYVVSLGLGTCESVEVCDVMQLLLPYLECRYDIIKRHINTSLHHTASK